MKCRSRNIEAGIFVLGGKKRVNQCLTDVSDSPT